MELIRGIHNIKSHHQGCVATIGNFDGVHLGHQQIIQQLHLAAQPLNLPTLLITFEPHPREFFAGDECDARLTRLREKLLILKNYPIDRVLCLHFNATLARQTAASFIEDLLIKKLQVKQLIVGDDFRFGYQRAGDYTLLAAAAKQHGFKLQKTETITFNDTRVSSTRVRQALAAGDLELAKNLLGRHYSMCGRVAEGDKRGRLIGFPTANIHLHRQKSPLYGVYVVQVLGISSKPIFGVANVGKRPTVGGTKTLLEVHLFNFDQDIYGKYLQVEFLKKLRDEKRFDSFELLKQQILQDAREAREYFNL